MNVTKQDVGRKAKSCNGMVWRVVDFTASDFYCVVVENNRHGKFFFTKTGQRKVGQWDSLDLVEFA